MRNLILTLALVDLSQLTLKTQQVTGMLEQVISRISLGLIGQYHQQSDMQ